MPIYDLGIEGTYPLPGKLGTPFNTVTSDVDYLTQHLGHSVWKRFVMQATGRTCCWRKVQARVSSRVSIQVHSDANVCFGLVHFPGPAQQLVFDHHDH